MNCPVCDKIVKLNQKECVCGWHNPGMRRLPKKVKESGNPVDTRCAYFSDNMRCQLPGGICSFPYATGPWYCEYHHANLDNPKKCIEYLQKGSDYENVMHHRRTIRDFLGNYLKELTQREKEIRS